jgi:hypothetical protein
MFQLILLSRAKAAFRLLCCFWIYSRFGWLPEECVYAGKPPGTVHVPLDIHRLQVVVRPITITVEAGGIGACNGYFADDSLLEDCQERDLHAGEYHSVRPRNVSG